MSSLNILSLKKKAPLFIRNPFFKVVSSHLCNPPPPPALLWRSQNPPRLKKSKKSLRESLCGEFLRVLADPPKTSQNESPESKDRWFSWALLKGNGTGVCDICVARACADARAPHKCDTYAFPQTTLFVLSKSSLIASSARRLLVTEKKKLSPLYAPPSKSPDLPILFSSFLKFRGFPCFFLRFCSLFQGFEGFGREENPCFSSGDPRFSTHRVRFATTSRRIPPHGGHHSHYWAGTACRAWRCTRQTHAHRWHPHDGRGGQVLDIVQKVFSEKVSAITRRCQKCVKNAPKWVLFYWGEKRKCVKNASKMRDTPLGENMDNTDQRDMGRRHGYSGAAHPPSHRQLAGGGSPQMPWIWAGCSEHRRVTSGSGTLCEEQHGRPAPRAQALAKYLISKLRAPLKGTNLSLVRGQTEPKRRFSQIFADFRRFSPFPRKYSIWKTQIFAENRRWRLSP